MESLFYDLRLALRHLRQRPLFALVAIASIAIGIGATTSIMSVANTLLLRPPAGLDDPSRVVEVSRTMGGRGRDTFSYPELLDMREQAGDALEQLAGWTGTEFSYSTGGDGERVLGLVASWNYFAVMGVQPLRGRFFTADEDATPGTHPVAVVSEAFWRGHLDADPGAVGRTISLNRRTFTIVGIVPASFQGHIFAFHPDIYVPMMMMAAARPGFGESNFTERRSSMLMAVGRLRPGVTVAGATNAVQTVFARQPQRNPDPRNVRSAIVEPLGQVPAAGRTITAAFLGVMLALVGVILLVSSANVAGMLLARAAARSREIAIRLALGSGRRRLVRQLLIEALVLFGAGGSLGLLLAWWGTIAIGHIPIPAPIPLAIDLSPDARVLFAGLALALLTGLVFGLAPALQATRADLADAMKTNASSVGRGSRMRQAFVMTQVGLSMILLLSAGLFLRSLQKAASVPIGFDPDGVQLVSFDLARDGYDEPHGQAFVADVLARLRAAPGIVAAGASTDLPLDMGISETPAWVPGSPDADANGWVQSAFYAVTDGYFDALRIPVREGRVFESRDVPGATPVVVISRLFAERVWPGQSALGRQLRWGDSTAAPLTVIGVVEDVKNQSLMESGEPTLYLPTAQQYQSSLTIAVRGTGDVAATLRRVMREADPRLSLSAIQSLTAVAGGGILPQRIAAMITSALGALALLLSALGVYGVVAYTVAQRTREIGVRMALGARRPDVVRLVLKGGLRLAVPGLALGLLVGLVLTRVLRSFILGVAPGDPATFLGVPAILLAAVVVACWAPARRAAGVEPTEALRAE